MKAWRYLEPTYADAAWVMGCVRIGTLASYGALEDKLQDALDGGVERVIDFLHIDDREGHRQDRELAQGLGFIVEDSEVTMIDCGQVLLCPPMYCMCLSDTPDNQYILDEGRSSVLEIIDVDQFARSVARSSPRFTGRYSYGRVSYEARRFNIRAEADAPNPFKKETRFAPEREVRIVWEPVSTRPEPFNLMASSLVGLLKPATSSPRTALRSAA